MRLLAVDPGDVHVGLALFEDDAEDWHIVSAWEEQPDEAADTVVRFIVEEKLDVLVVEEFRLYPWKAQQQAFSQMKTAELIGALRLIHRWYGQECQWVEQGASIKKPTQAILRRLEIKKAPGSKGQHVVDAQLHGWHFILRKEDAWEE